MTNEIQKKLVRMLSNFFDFDEFDSQKFIEARQDFHHLMREIDRETDNNRPSRAGPGAQGNGAHHIIDDPQINQKRPDPDES